MQIKKLNIFRKTEGVNMVTVVVGALILIVTILCGMQFLPHIDEDPMGAFMLIGSGFIGAALVVRGTS